MGLTKRATFLIDEDGIVRWTHVSPTGMTYQTAQDLISHF
jgi:alkyl hydroperoxide reductase subunit AhpC